MKYSNVLAEACFVAGNIAACIREALEGNDHALIVNAWIDLDSDDEKKALASLRSNLNREAKKLYDHGLKVDIAERKLVAVKPRNRKSKEDSEFLKLAKEVDKAVSPEMKANLIKLINEALVS